MPKQILYKDIDIKFVANPYTSDVPLLENDMAIVRSIKNLIFTNRYERPYKPNLFTDSLASLFENFSSLEANLLQENISDVINIYEKRAVLLNVIVKLIPDSNEIHVAVIFRPVNSQQNVEINMFLQRVR